MILGGPELTRWFWSMRTWTRFSRCVAGGGTFPLERTSGWHLRLSAQSVRNLSCGPMSSTKPYVIFRHLDRVWRGICYIWASESLLVELKWQKQTLCLFILLEQCHLRQCVKGSCILQLSNQDLFLFWAVWVSRVIIVCELNLQSN